MRRSPLLFFLLAGCGTDEIPNTGGFRETIIDRSIRHGQQIELADIDADGRTDIVAAFSLTDAVHLYLNTAEGFEPISISGAGSIVALDTVTFDIDGDSDLDVAAVGLSQRRFFNTSAGELVWYENPGDPRGVWTTRPISRPVLTDTSSKSDQLPWGACCIAAGDLDGDGRDDLVVGLGNANDERGTIFGNRIVWYRNEGGLFTGPSAIDTSLLDVSEVLIADVDGDDRLDVIAGADTGAELAWYQNAASSQAGARFVKYTIWNEGSPHGLVFTDADGDSDRELVASAYSLTSSVSLAIFEPPAAPADPWTRTELARGFGAGLNDQPKIAVADFDGDGAADIAVSSQASGDLRVYRRSGDGYERGDVRGGYLGLTGLTAADVDGDGRIDLVTSTFEFGSRDRLAWWRNESFPE